MNRKIRIDSNSLKLAAKRIKKELGKNSPKYNQILSKLIKLFGYESMSNQGITDTSNNCRFSDKSIADLEDLRRLDIESKKIFSEYGKISTLPFIDSEMKNQKEALKDQEDIDFNIVNYIRIYNGMNDRNINNGKEIRTKEDFYHVVPELIEDLAERFKDFLEIDERSVGDYESLVHYAKHKHIMEPYIHYKYKRLGLFRSEFSTFFYYMIYDSLFNKERAKKNIIEKIDEIFDDITFLKEIEIDGIIGHFPLSTKYQTKIKDLEYYKIVSKDNVLFLGENTKKIRQNKNLTTKLKNIFKEDEDKALYLKKEECGSHILFFGSQGSGVEMSRQHYIFQSALKGNGFIHFNYLFDINYVKLEYKNILSSKNKNKKLIIISKEEFFNLRKKEVKSFISKNKNVIINLYEKDNFQNKPTEEEENQMIKIMGYIANSIHDQEQYIISNYNILQYSAKYYAFMTKIMPILKIKGICLYTVTNDAISRLARSHNIEESKEVVNFIKTYDKKMIFKLYDPTEILYLFDNFSMTRLNCRDIKELKPSCFYLYNENKGLDHAIYVVMKRAYKENKLRGLP